MECKIKDGIINQIKNHATQNQLIYLFGLAIFAYFVRCFNIKHSILKYAQYVYNIFILYGKMWIKDKWKNDNAKKIIIIH